MKPETVQEERVKQRTEIREEHWDHWRHRRHRESVGTVYTSSDFDEDDCQISAVLDGVTYYACEGVWYRRAYTGGTVTYVVVDKPRNN